MPDPCQTNKIILARNEDYLSMYAEIYNTLKSLAMT